MLNYLHVDWKYPVLHFWWNGLTYNPNSEFNYSKRIYVNNDLKVIIVFPLVISNEKKQNKA